MTQQDHWIDFRKALCESIVAIGEQYFQVQRSDENVVYRERVYCYELYHQLRCKLEDKEIKNHPSLHGEIDKSGHTRIRKALGYNTNPDFVFHVPGTNENLVVMEVKTVKGAKRKKEGKTGAERDIEKLQKFLNAEELKYQHGILLIFGSGNSPNLKIPDQIIVLHHDEIGKDPKILPSKNEWCTDPNQS